MNFMSSSQSSPGMKRRWWLVLTVLVPLLACIAWWGTSAINYQQTFHPTGQIIFECWPERRTSRVCIVNADGSQKRVITPTHISMPDGISGDSPTWSPDRKQLAFLKLDETTNEAVGLFVVDKDRNNETLLMQGLALHSQWSPDNTKIAYVFSKPVTSNTYLSYIYVINADGSNQRQLASAYISSPSWSPDSTKIAFTCGGVCVMNADGSGRVSLDKKGLSPSWSPDGQYIVYYKSDPACLLCPNSGQLWIMRADGSQQTKITDGPVDQNPVWQPAP